MSIDEQPEENQSEVIDEVRKLQEAVDKVAGTAAGERLLGFIYEQSGYDSLLVAQLEDNRVDALATQYNLGRRSIWLALRGLLTKEQKYNIETGG